MAKVKLISRRKKQTTHVDGEKVGAMTTSHSDSLKQTGARNTHLNFSKEEEKEREM